MILWVFVLVVVFLRNKYTKYEKSRYTNKGRPTSSISRKIHLFPLLIFLNSFFICQRKACSWLSKTNIKQKYSRPHQSQFSDDLFIYRLCFLSYHQKPDSLLLLEFCMSGVARFSLNLTTLLGARLIYFIFLYR